MIGAGNKKISLPLLVIFALAGVAASGYYVKKEFKIYGRKQRLQPVQPASPWDWPQWCGRDGKNMVARATGIPATFYPGDKDPQGGFKLETARGVDWAVHTTPYTCTSPVISGGRIFIGGAKGGNGILKCLDEKTGELLWQWLKPPRKVPKMIAGRLFLMDHFARVMGNLSTPYVEGDRLYFVSPRCEVLCLDVRGSASRLAKLKSETSTESLTARLERGDTAKTFWSFDMWDQVGTRPADVANCSVIVHGDFVYVCTSNGVDREANSSHHDEFRKPPAPDAPSLIVLDKKTGQLAAVDDAKIGPRLYHGQWSSPAVGRVGDRDLVFFGGGDGFMYAFPALTEMPAQVEKLKPVWSFDCNPPEYKQYGKMDPIVFYTLGDTRRGDSKNKKSDGSYAGLCEIIATPVFYNNRVYVTIGRDPEHGRGRGALWCIDATQKGDITKTGKIWCYLGIERSLSTVSIADGLLYIADRGGRFHCLDADTGKPYWVHDTKAEIWSSSLVVDGKVFLPSYKGLFVFAAGKTKNLLGQIDLGNPMLSSPVIAGGRLYVSSKNTLWAVKNTGSGGGELSKAVAAE